MNSPPVAHPDDATAPRTAPLFGPAALIAACALVAVLSAAQTYYTNLAEGEAVTWSGTLGRQLLQWFAWGALLPGIVHVSRRIDRVGGIGVRIGAYAVVGVIASVLHSGVAWAVRSAVLPATTRSSSFSLYARVWLIFDLVTYGALVAATLAVEHWRRGRTHELRAAQLGLELSQAHLRALQMQLRPHFLFNTLNTVSMLIRTAEGPRALTVIAGLGDLLRQILADDGANEVPLREELAFVESYLGIERVRFQDRLRVAIDVHTEALDAHVPRFVLQPLVENAIRHGLAGCETSGALTITGSRSNGALSVTIHDDGPGPPIGLADGIGLRNTRERLRRLYGDQARLSLERAPGGGAMAVVRLPWHTRPLDGSAP